MIDIIFIFLIVMLIAVIATDTVIIKVIGQIIYTISGFVINCKLDIPERSSPAIFWPIVFDAIVPKIIPIVSTNNALVIY